MADPVPGEGEVRVRILASAISPTDLYARGGLRDQHVPPTRVVPHQDGSGVIDLVGPGVPADRVGEMVWIYMARKDGGDGTAAELCVVPAQRAVAAPPDADPLTLACLGIPWITAYAAAAFESGGRPGITLVTGAAGAVGSFAVQAARALGQTPVATVSRGSGIILARQAGAAAVFERLSDAEADILALTGGEGVDRAIEVDLASNLDVLLRVVRPGSPIVAYGTGGRTANVPVSVAIRRQLHLRFIYTYGLPEDLVRAAVTSASQLVADRQLRPLPTRSFGLSEIVAAHEAAEQGNQGSRIVCVPD
jgi:NADPH2:quinone reductase